MGALERLKALSLQMDMSNNERYLQGGARAGGCERGWWWGWW